MSGIKKAISVIAFDDGYFKPRTKGSTLLVGVVYRLDHRIEGIASTKIKVDSLDVTNKLIRLWQKSKFKPQTKYLLLSGINFAGFNIIDLDKVFRKVKRPIIIVFRKKPNLAKIKRALSKFKDSEKRVKLMEKGGEIHTFNSIRFQCYGLPARKARTVIRKSLLHARLPEPVRLAHMIASGLTRGESTTTQ